MITDNLPISDGEWWRVLKDAAREREPFCLPNPRGISRAKLLVEK